MNRKDEQREIYESYLPYILTIVRRFGIHDHDEADVIQEIFIEVFVSIAKYDKRKGEFKWWLKSIAIHKILKIQRNQKQINQTLLYNTEKVDSSSSSETQDKDLILLDVDLLLELIRNLPDGYRTVFNMYILDNYSHKEIGEKLGISEASSRSQLTRAKQLLRTKLYSINKRNRYEII